MNDKESYTDIELDRIQLFTDVLSTEIHAERIKVDNKNINAMNKLLSICLIFIGKCKYQHLCLA